MMAKEFFRKLADLSDFVDLELESLEVRARTLDTCVSIGKHPAVVAEEVYDEIRDISSQVDSLSSTVSQHSSSMDDFLKNTLEIIAAKEEDVKKVEQYAAQYGYVAATNRPQLDLDNLVSTPAKTPPASEKSPQKVQEETPDILNFGLSKKTLSNMGFKFKKDDEEEETDNIEQQRDQVKKSQEESDDSPEPLSILKKPPQKHNISIPGNVSTIEISPGLFVRRPSTKKRQEAKPEQVCTTTKKTPTKPNSKSKSPEGTPVLPALKTIDVGKYLKNMHNAQHAGAEIHNKKEKEVVLKKKPQQDIMSSPEMPHLQTVDVAKFLLSSQKKQHVVETVTDWDGDVETPEMPDLPTVDPKIVASMGKPRLRDEDDSTTSLAENIPPPNIHVPRDDTPEMPNLSTVDQGKKIASTVQPENESPKMPVFSSEMTMNLLRQFKQ